MDALTHAMIAASVLAATPGHAEPIERWRPLIAEASERFGVPALWIERVIHAESRGLTTLAGRPITSRAGAMGLMQLMPATWTDMRTRLGLGANPHDPHDNILAGTLYLRLMYERFGYPGLFGAYNGGPARYADYVARGRALPVETRAYLTTLTNGAASRGAGPVARMNPLFFVGNDRTANIDRESAPPALFVLLSDGSSAVDNEGRTTPQSP